MLIIAGYTTVDAKDRDDYVSAFRGLVERSRQAPGCLDGAVTADSVDDERVYVFERWESWEDVEKWRGVANAPDLGIPMKSVDVVAYEIASEQPPFRDQ